MPVNSDGCPESNHGLGFYLYYVCCIFDICQEPCVEQRPTLNSNIWNEEDDWMARDRGEGEGNACIPLSSVSKQLAHPAQLVSVLIFKVWSPGREFEPCQDQPWFFFFKTHIFSYFHILIFFIHFNFFSIFYFCIKKLSKNIFLFTVVL